MNIKQALATLDPATEEHWTADGLPRVETVAALVGGGITRRDITDADPTFLRPKASSGTPPPIGHEPEGTPAESTPEPDAPVESTPEPDAPAESTPETDAPETEPAEAPAAPAEPDAVPPGTTPETAPDLAPPTEEDPAQAAYVDIMDDVVGMSPQEVFRDMDLVDRAIDEFGRQAAVLTARREAIITQLKDVGRRSAMLTNARNKLERLGKRTKKPSSIQNYLKAQQKARAERAERARMFIRAGTTAEDVKEQLGGPSKMDAAMKQRKVARGARRPAYPVSAGK